MGTTQHRMMGTTQQRKFEGSSGTKMLVLGKIRDNFLSSEVILYDDVNENVVIEQVPK